MPPNRNIKRIGPSGKQKPIPGFIWIPPTDGSIFKIEVVTDSETFDITDEIIEGGYTEGVTETIGDFTFTVDNSDERHTNHFSIYNTVNVYMNYGATASILKFSGLVERPSRSNNNIILIGKSKAIRTTGKNVTYSATDKARSTVLTEIIEKYFSGVITTNNVETDNTLITVNYEDKPFWEVVQELCEGADFDAYVDVDLDFHYFSRGSRINTTDAAVHEYNIIETGDFSSDLQQTANRVKVYGKKKGSTVILATAEDEDAQNNISGDIRELRIEDNSILTVTQAKARADFELARAKDPPTVGEIKSLLLPTISPGELVRISDPLNGINPGNYQVQKYTHSFNNDEPPMTSLTIEKERSSIPKVLKRRIKFETDISESVNPSEMDQSILFDFSQGDTGTHSNTEVDLINGGILQVTSGSGTGTWTSPTTIVAEEPTDGEIRIDGDNLGPDLNVFISHTGGQQETRVGFNQFVGGGTQEVTDGKQLRLRLVIGNEDIKIRRITWLYK